MASNLPKLALGRVASGGRIGCFKTKGEAHLLQPTRCEGTQFAKIMGS